MNETKCSGCGNITHPVNAGGMRPTEPRTCPICLQLKKPEDTKQVKEETEEESEYFFMFF